MVDIILLVANFSFIVPIFTGVFRFKDLQGHLRNFFYFLIFSSVFEIALFVLYEQDIRTDWIIHFYTPVELFFVSQVLRSFNINEKAKRIIQQAVLTLLGIWGAYFIGLLAFSLLKDHSLEYFKDSFARSEPISFAIEALLMIDFAILLLLNRFSQKMMVPPVESKSFWFSAGVLIYFIGNIILYPALNIVVSEVSGRTAQNLWVIHSICNFTGYIFFAIVFLCKKQ